MAFSVILSSNFSKRSNSTKQPQGGTTFSGVLKEPCSLLEPTILIESASATFPSFNYAHIPAFQRYYYITDIVSINGLWEVHLRSDPLATYKTQIGSIIAYVERASADFDGTVQDTLYPTTSAPVVGNIPCESTYSGVAPSKGAFVLGVYSKNGGGQVGGAVTYYVMTPVQIRTLMAYVLSDQFLDDAGFDYTGQTTPVPLPYPENGVTQDLARCIVKPLDYIASCMWFPVSPSTIAESSANVTLGYWDFGENTFSASLLSGLIYEEVVDVTMTEHPQNTGANARGAFLNRAPYTTATLYIPPFGEIPVDLSYRDPEGAGYIRARICVDTITGKANMRVSIDTHVFAEASAMFGVPIQLSQITPDMLSGIADIGGAFMSLAMGQVGGFMHTIGNAIKDYMPSPRVSGTQGSFLESFLDPRLEIRQALLVEENNTELGRPLCKNRTISTLSGYIKCGEATDSLPGFETERTEIQRALLNGFFWE